MFTGFDPYKVTFKDKDVRTAVALMKANAKTMEGLIIT